MAEINHVLKSSTTKYTKNGATWTSPSDNHKFLGTELDASSDYVFIVQASIAGDDETNTHIGVRMHDGTSTLTGSDHVLRSSTGDTNYGDPYMWVGKITTPASSIPDYELQAQSDGTDNLAFLETYMLALKLSDMDSADYAYDEDTTLYNSVSQATDTFSAAAVTVGDGSDDWAIFGCSKFLYNASIGRNWVFCGEGGSPAKVEPMSRSAAEATDEEHVFGWMTYKAAPASETYTAGFRSDNSGTSDVEYNAIFALNLNQFTGHVGDHDDESGAPLSVASADTLYQAASASGTTPADTAYDWCVLGLGIYNAGSDSGNSRPQGRVTYQIGAGSETFLSGYVTNARGGYESRGNNDWTHILSMGEISAVTANATLKLDADIRDDGTLAVTEPPNIRGGVLVGFTWDGPNFPDSTQSIIKSIERVTVDWDATSEPVTQNLSKNQDETQCVPFFTKRLVSGSLADDFRERTMKVEMIDNAGTPAVRVSAAGKSDADDHRIECYVVEFQSSITVQQVDADIADASGSANITIDDVSNQTSAFFLYSYQYTHGSAQDRPDYACVRPIWNGASTTSVTIERTGTTGTIDGTLYVVSCSSSEFSVQHRDISVAATDELTNDTITAVQPASSFLLTHFRSSEAEDDPLDWSLVADLSTATNVRVRRSIAGASNAAANVGVQVVTALGGQWSVHRGDFTTTSNLTEQTVISAVDLTRALVKTGTHESGLNSLGTSDLTAGTIIDEVGPAAYLSATNTITWVRESVSETGNTIPYEVIQFSAGLDNPILIPTGPLR
jgi:hypothetical protein